MTIVICRLVGQQPGYMPWSVCHRPLNSSPPQVINRLWAVARYYQRIRKEEKYYRKSIPAFLSLQVLQLRQKESEDLMKRYVHSRSRRKMVHILALHLRDHLHLQFV